MPSSLMALIVAIDSSVHCLHFFFLIGLFGVIGNHGLPDPFFFFRTEVGAINIVAYSRVQKQSKES